MIVPYDEEVRNDDTSRAVDTVTAALFPADESPLAIDLAGTCPRCSDVLPRERRWLVAVAPASKLNDRQRKKLANQLKKLGIDLSEGDETFRVTCGCDGFHPGRPEGKRGCGATFNIRVRWP